MEGVCLNHIVLGWVILHQLKWQYLLRNHVGIVTAAVESLHNMLEGNADEGLQEVCP